MVNNVNNQINNLWQLIILLILPFTFLALITKINLMLTAKYQKKTHQKDLLEEKKIIHEKVLLIAFQLSIIPLSKQFVNIFWDQLIPFLSLILLLQFVISFSLLLKSNRKTELTNNPSNYGFIILITIIFGQFLIISWQLHHLLFTNLSNFIVISMIYTFFTLFIYRLFSQNFLVIKYLINETYQILITKKNNELNKVKKSLIIYNKTQVIANLWDFANWKNNQNTESTIKTKDQKIIKAQFILFIIACINRANKNIMKLQKIIINGWKISLIE